MTNLPEALEPCPKWANDSDPVGALAIKLAARAASLENDGDEWTWRDIASAAFVALSPDHIGDANKMVAPNLQQTLAGSPAMEGREDSGETLEQYADRIVAKTRRYMMDRLDDDVIGHLGESHLVFGKACAIEAVHTAMREMAEGMATLPAPAVAMGEGEK